MEKHAGDERLDYAGKEKFKQLKNAIDTQGNEFSELNWDDKKWRVLFDWR